MKCSYMWPRTLALSLTQRLPLPCNDSHLEEEEKKEKEAAERTASVKETLPTVKSGVLQDMSNKIKRISAKVRLGQGWGKGLEK